MDLVCLDFLNSEFRDFRGRWIRDDLLRPEWLTQFLARWDLEVASPPDPATLSALIALRSQLQHMVEKLVGSGQLPDTDLALLNSILLSIPVSQRLEREGEHYHLEIVPKKKDWQWVQVEIVASFADLLVNYDLRRLRICENHYCRAIFYDESKSRTQRFCTPDKCANLMKIRRFRARHKDTPHSTQ